MRTFWDYAEYQIVRKGSTIIKYAQTKLEDLQKWNIVNMLDKEDIEVKTIKKLFTFFDNYIIPS